MLARESSARSASPRETAWTMASVPGGWSGWFPHPAADRPGCGSGENGCALFPGKSDAGVAGQPRQRQVEVPVRLHEGIPLGGSVARQILGLFQQRSTSLMRAGSACRAARWVTSPSRSWRNSEICSIVMRWDCTKSHRLSVMESALISLTKTPPRLPLRTSISPFCSSTRRDSRSVLRLTSSRPCNSRSAAAGPRPRAGP